MSPQDAPEERRAGKAGVDPRSHRALVILPLFDAKVILALCERDLAEHHEDYSAVRYLREAVDIAQRLEERL